MEEPTDPELVAIELEQQPVWRVGYAPNIWEWSDWKWAEGGRFHGRWDDIDGNFRTLYVGSMFTACLLEVLAPLRPDPVLVDEIAGVIEDRVDAEEFPSADPGEVDRAWLEPRAAGRARLDGRYCAVTRAESLAALRPSFIARALALGRADFDAAALKDGQTRALTQSVSTYIFERTDLAGLQFASRHGDDMPMWAIFERAGDPLVSALLSDGEGVELTAYTPELLTAFRLLGLRWRGEGVPDPMPLLLVQVDSDEISPEQIYGPGGPGPRDPLTAALMFQFAVVEAPTLFEAGLDQLLLVDPSRWGDFSEAATALRGLAVANRVTRDADEPDRVAYIRFIDYAGDTMAQGSGELPIDEGWLLTLRLEGDGSDALWKIVDLRQVLAPTSSSGAGKVGPAATNDSDSLRDDFEARTELFAEVYLRRGWMRVLPPAAVNIMTALVDRPLNLDDLEANLRAQKDCEQGWEAEVWEPLHEWTDEELQRLNEEFAGTALAAGSGQPNDAESVMAEEADERAQRIAELAGYTRAVGVEEVVTMRQLLAFLIACSVLVEAGKGTERVLDYNPSAPLPAEVLPLTQTRVASEDQLRWQALHESTSYGIITAFDPMGERVDSLSVSLVSLAAALETDPESVRAAIGNLLDMGDFSATVDVESVDPDDIFDLGVDWDLFDSSRITVRLSQPGETEEG